MTFTIPGSSSPDQPPVIGNPFWNGIPATTGSSTLVTASAYPGYQLFLQGVDLVDTSFTNGHNCNLFISSTTIIHGNFTLFQGFTYTSSQACFSWRGNFPLPSDAIVHADAVVGSWDVSCYGVMFPQGPSGRWS